MQRHWSKIYLYKHPILETLRSIVPAITQKKLSNKFLVYEGYFLNLEEVLRGIIFYIVCVFGRDIDRQKFCKYGWENLFRVEKESLVVSNSGDRNKLAVEIQYFFPL